MIDKPLYSIILLHYNQPNYVKQAIDSILEQTYKNIEFIFADDCSSKINVEDLINYVQKNKKDNIKDVIWQINSENVGTVKSLNIAIDKCHGEYLLFFAADDALCNPNVISNFISSFKKINEDVYMISSQCHMMDIKMEEEIEMFVKPSFANSFNKFSADEQFKVFTKTCFLAMGATSMKMSMFKKFGKFNEEYKFIEDWSYFLHLTRSGGKVEYFDFDTLLHRDGGVSHYVDNKLIPTHVLAFKLDMVRIFENEILPHINNFTYEEKFSTIQWYDNVKNDYINLGGREKIPSRFNLLKYYPLFWLKKFIIEKKSISSIKMQHWLNRIKATCVIWLSIFVFYQVASKEILDVVFPAFIIDALGMLYIYIIPILISIFALNFVINTIIRGTNYIRNFFKNWFI